MTTRYINTASTAGGDGTTNATTGANRAYASHSGWEAAEQAILAEDHTVWFEGTAADTTKFIIDGWTPGSFKIILKTDPNAAAGRHVGIYSTSKARLETSLTVGFDYSIQILENNVEITGYQVGCATSGSASDAAGISVSTFAGVAVTGAKIEGCFIKKLSGTVGPCQGLRVWVSGSIARIGKNIFVDWRNGAADFWASVSFANSPTLYIYRNTAINSYYGYQCNGQLTKQNIAQSCTDGYSGVVAASSDRNCSDIAADAPGTNPVTGTVTFVGGGDYHLAAADTVAKDAGISLSSDADYPLSTDIDEQSITGTPDLGADEYFAAAADAARGQVSIPFHPGRSPGRSGTPVSARFYQSPRNTSAAAFAVYTQFLLGTLSFSGANTKNVNKVVAGTLTFSGVLSKITSKTLSGLLTFAGELAKTSSKIFSGLLSFSGALAKTTAKIFSGVLSFSGSTTKTTLKVLSAALTFIGTTVKRTDKIASGTLSFSGALASSRTLLRSIAGTLSFTGEASTLRNLIKSIGGSLSFASGAVLKSIAKPVSGTLSFSGGILRRVDRLLSGVLAFAGSAVKRIPISLSGSLSFSAAVTAVKLTISTLYHYAESIVLRVINELTITKTDTETTVTRSTVGTTSTSATNETTVLKSTNETTIG